MVSWLPLKSLQTELHEVSAEEMQGNGDGLAVADAHGAVQYGQGSQLPNLRRNTGQLVDAQVPADRFAEL